MDFHSMAGCRSRVSAGTFLVASPMISMLRTNARFAVSSLRNRSRSKSLAEAMRKSSSSRI
jgi:hypothetical protein